MTIDELRKSGRIVHESVAGSILYGINVDGVSDKDTRGIYLPTRKEALRFYGNANREVSDPKQDVKFYSLDKFIELAKGCNPNIIELLYIPDEFIIQKTPAYDRLVENRRLFMSRHARHTFLGYAYAQVKKARGTNKKGNEEEDRTDKEGFRLLGLLMNFPLPESDRAVARETSRSVIRQTFGRYFLDYIDKLPSVEWTRSDIARLDKDDVGKSRGIIMSDMHVRKMMPPSLVDYIRRIGVDNNGFPFRPLPFNGCCIIGDASKRPKYDVSRVEGAVNIYRLYNGGNGFISSDGTQVVCHDISAEREKTDYAGVIQIKTDAYDKDMREYQSFWAWMSTRNEKRHTHDWDARTCVDYKNLMHTVRLLMCAESIARTGEPKVRFEGEEREYLLSIRAGKVKYEEIQALADRKEKEINKLFDASSLPSSPDEDMIFDLYDRIITEEVLNGKSN